METSPWSAWAPAAADFCEASLEAWVRQPGNTLSNAGFLAVGAAIVADARRPERAGLRGFGWILVGLALGSAFFHASETLAGQALDWAGMLGAGAWMIGACARRLTPQRRPALAPAIFAATFALFFVARDSLRAVLAAEGAVLGAMELALTFGPRRAASWRWNVASWIAFVPAMAAWIADDAPAFCDPRRHWLSGHAVWHLLAAVGFGCSWLYYAGIPELARPGAGAALEVPS